MKEFLEAWEDFLFLSSCLHICIRGLPKNVQDKTEAWETLYYFLGSVCRLACVLPPVPRRRLPCPPRPPPPPPPPCSVSRDEVLLAITYLDGSVACGRVTLGLSHVSVTTVSLASCPLPGSPDASPLCHPPPARSELIDMSRHQQTTTSSHSSPPYFPTVTLKSTWFIQHSFRTKANRVFKNRRQNLDLVGWTNLVDQVTVADRQNSSLFLPEKEKSETCYFIVLC